MQSDEHKLSSYEDFIKDVKYILNDHVANLKDCQGVDVTKQILSMVWDKDCKYLRPKELTTESSDEDFPMKICTTEEEKIFTEFLENMLTSKVRT